MLDFIPFPIWYSILSKCSLSDIFNFICMSKEHFEIYYLILKEKIKETSDYDLAYIRSHGNSFIKEMARKELLQRNNDTIREAVKLSSSNYNKHYGPIQLWDVSEVTDMSFLFENMDEHFNEDISNWDVSNVTDMSAMFNNATNFNQDISNWNVSNVTDMSAMFYYARSFNQNISNWDVSNVTNMRSVFNNATNFNQNIEGCIKCY